MFYLTQTLKVMRKLFYKIFVFKNKILNPKIVVFTNLFSTVVLTEGIIRSNQFAYLDSKEGIFTTDRRILPFLTCFSLSYKF